MIVTFIHNGFAIDDVDFLADKVRKIKSFTLCDSHALTYLKCQGLKGHRADITRMRTDPAVSAMFFLKFWASIMYFM